MDAAVDDLRLAVRAETKIGGISPCTMPRGNST
jgi:hypothetical protein